MKIEPFCIFIMLVLVLVIIVMYPWEDLSSVAFHEYQSSVAMDDQAQSPPQSLYAAPTDISGPPTAEVLHPLSASQHQPANGGNSEPTATATNGATTATNSAPSAVMSEYDALFARLKEKPHDPEGWRRLVDNAESSGEIDKIRAAYDALLKQYPNTVCFWSLICALFLSLPSPSCRFSFHRFVMLNMVQY